MTTDELEMLIAHGEDDKIEYKKIIELSSHHGKAEFIKDVMALANAHGDRTAYMLIGVDNKKRDLHDISGLQFDDANLQQLVNSSVEPPIAFSYRTAELRGGTIGIVEIPPSEERFHLIKKGLQSDGVAHLEQGQRLIRRGSGRVPVTAWDDRELRKQIVKQHLPQPDLDVTFADGKRETTVQAQWKTSEMDFMTTLARMQTPTLFGTAPLPDGTCTISLRVSNLGTIEATNVSIFILLPDGCTIPEYHDYGLILSKVTPAWAAYHDHEENQISIRGNRLTHHLSREEDDLHITFPSTGTFQIRWKAHAGNMREKKTGTLTIRVV